MAEFIPVHLILMPEPVSCGMDPYVLFSLAGTYRKTNEHAPAILVTRYGDLYKLTDGRHRLMASHMAGRKTIWAVIEE
jgi:hypothetical protein